MINLGKLKEIKDLRKVWPHEALDFTPWLAEDDNLTLLADAVGLEITVDETESSVGDFNVDIYATETGTDRKIIIENQLEDTNHDHLGKLITYASGKSADIVIWVVKRAREEHRSAIEWLNNHTDENIALVLALEDEGSIESINAKLEKLQKELLKRANAKKDFNDLADEIDRLRELKQNAMAENAEREGLKQRIAEMQEFLTEQRGTIQVYDEQVVRKLIEKITVHDEKVTVAFKSGMEIDVKI